MKFEHIKMLSEGKAEIRLYEAIGQGRSTGDSIASEIDFLIEFAEVTEINIRINSGGGNMVEGFGIISAIQAAIDKGIIVSTQNDGLAGSMALPILSVGSKGKRKMVDFGMTMLHDPAIGGKHDEKTKTMLHKFKDSAIQIFANVTGLGKTKLNKMMTEETWLNAKESLKMGFIDEIIETGKGISEQASNFIEDKNATELIGVYNDIINNKINVKPKKSEMKKVAMHFNLNEDASTDAIMNEVKKIEAANSELTKEVENKSTEVENLTTEGKAKDTEISELKEAAKGNVEMTATTLVDAAIKSGKLKKDSREGMIKTASENMEMFNTMLDNMTVPNPDLLGVLNAAKTTGTTEAPEMSLREMEKQDPEKLEAIRNDNPELYAKMYNAEYPVG